MLRLALVITLFALFGSHTFAQDMTVYTTVSVVGDDGQPESVGRSLTLFHAGKVYDYMEDAGELVVLDAEAGRFLIVNGNYTGTRVEFDELNQFLKVAKTQTEAYMAELALKGDADRGPLTDWLKFQLDPRFEERETEKQALKLDSPVMQYNVETSTAPEPKHVEQYLSYADQAAQLNFVLHPGATFPAPRLALNLALRQRGVLPTSVELVSRAGNPVTLRAKHIFQWRLESPDKQHIHQWERMLSSKQVRWVGFHEYQQRLLADAARRAK
ncbi:MAG: hypothetical protein U0992_18155 [Planctomycetaceae bacterium]